MGAGAFRPAEIISADSMQVYRGMDIGTAKPSPAARALLPHHLIDIREPSEQFNAGDFTRLAREACAEAEARGKLPVVCGGSFFYLANLIGGLPAAPPASAAVRETLKNALAEKGAAALMEELSRCDAESAARIHIHDEYRLLRALEVYRISGRPLSAFRQSGKIGGGGEGADTAEAPRFVTVVLECERPVLYERINARAAAMMRQGLAGEAAALYRRGLTPDAPGLKAIGYHEFFCKDENNGWRFLLEDGREKEIEALIAQNTRRYAKRQMTWMRSITPHIRVQISPGGFAKALDSLKRFMDSYGL
jgi:tRNA dimethylallyltransferase